MNVVLHVNLLHAAFIIIIIYENEYEYYIYTKKFHNSYKCMFFRTVFFANLIHVTGK